MDDEMMTRPASSSKTSQSSRPGLLRAAALVAASGAMGRRSASTFASSAFAHGKAGRGTQTQQRRPAENAPGQDAQAPQDITAKGWKGVLLRIFDRFGKDRVLLVAAGVTFYGLLSLFPMIAAFVSFYGLIADPANIKEHVDSVSGVLPGGAVDVIGGQIERITSQPRGRLDFSFALGLAVALWSANAGVKALFDALNVAYGEDEKRSFLVLNVQSLAFTLAGMAAAMLAMGAVVIIPLAINLLVPGQSIGMVLSLVRWPVLLLLVVAGLAALYRFGPSRDAPQWRWLSPGSIVAACVWLVASIAFSWYAANFGSFNETYGSLCAVIGFMIWLWISSAIILLGAELNAEAERQTMRDARKAPDAVDNGP